jgi:aryl-alcohol dehydrogenase-like predicted oxidoreductase
MEKRQLGKSDLMVAPLAFGGNVFGWTADEKTSFKLLDEFTANGFNLIDTADVYSRWASGVGGESETIIGKWLKKQNNRHKVIIATKVGMDMGEGNRGISKKNILRAVEDSLRRLQVDHIDLYQSHKDDNVTPVEDTLDAYRQLIKEGKVRFIGASNFSPERLQKSLDAAAKYNLPRYETLQPHYNLCERKLFEGALEEICLKNQVGVISYYSLASGFLTGKYRSEKDLQQSVRGRGAGKYLNESGLRILKALDSVAAEHNVKPASIALAWLMERKSVTAPIASATSVTQLQDLMKAAHVSPTKTEILQLDAASKN